MKVFKTYLVCLLSLALVSGVFAQRSAEKTLVKSFNLLGNDLVDLDLKGDIEIVEWNSPSIRIEMLITIENGNDTMLKSLVKAGRYNLTSSESDEGFVISMPGLEREITIKGAPLMDGVTYIVSLPSDVSVRETSVVSAKVD